MFTNFEIMQNTLRGGIRIFFIHKSITVKNRNRLKEFILGMVKEEGFSIATINYVFCSDNYLLSINRKYLNHDDYTDIITFDLSEGSKDLSAEIYISVDRLRDNAKQFGTLLKDELLRVMIHGILHLCGYNDKTSSQKAGMRERESNYMAKYYSNVPREKSADSK